MSNDLSEDLIVEIFSRLPSKSLLRFRSLSKSLHACVGSPRFIRLHTLRSPKRFTIIHRTVQLKLIYALLPEDKLSYNPYTHVTAIEYPFKSVSIVGSCNGILCVYECGKGVNLWNPSIRRKVTIPDLPLSSDRLVHGFGFDTIMNDHKILKISKGGSFVYTMKTRAWREIASPATRFCEVNSSQCLFNGALHWVVKWYLTDTLDVSHSYILRFDLGSEVFSTIALPEPSWDTGVVTVIKGCLAMIYSKPGCCYRHDNVGCFVWVRQECDNTASWSVVLALNTNPFRGVKKVFQRATNDDLVFNHDIVFNHDQGMQAYNPKERVLSRIRIFGHRSLIADMDLCVESLELLDMGTSCDQGSRLLKIKKSTTSKIMQI